MKAISKRRSHYSAVIVGAGPAGANLARLLSGNVESLLLVDGSGSRGGKVCAGLLSPDARDVLARYDVNLPTSVLSSPQLFSVRTVDLADSAPPIRRYPRNYVNMDRDAFDRFLRAMVPETVDTVSALCTELLRLDQGFSLTLREKEDTFTVTADFVIGADGASSIVRRTLFPEIRMKRYTAIQQWFKADARDSYYSCIFDRATSESCSWIFFKDGSLVFGGAFSDKHCRAAFEAQKKKLVQKGLVPEEMLRTPIRTEACAVLRPTLLRGAIHGRDGAFLVGEAAGFISPSSLEGISYALLSAEALARAFTRETPSRVLKHYKKGTRGLRRKLFFKYLKRPFMYAPFLRSLILRSGIGAIRPTPPLEKPAKTPLKNRNVRKEI